MGGFDLDGEGVTLTAAARGEGLEMVSALWSCMPGALEGENSSWCSGANCSISN